ncbi:MAG TPA: TerC family protein [Burkholderiales bacterium]|nr:TerC family protein [Burkholderiales bacterium]
MELFSAQFFSALITIIIIDLVLAGDNAIVIALAARNVSRPLQKRAIIWGTAGAIVVRVLMTVVVVWLLQVPWLLLAGGLLLVWIAYRLLVPAEEGRKDSDHAAGSFWGAMKTIIIADAAMGLDNVLAVAGAAHGSFLLVIIGLLVSVPIVVWGSTLILKWIERYPVLIYVGAAVLAWTAAKMLSDEPMLEEFLNQHKLAVWAIYTLVIGGVLYAGYAVNKRKKQAGSAMWLPD